MVLDQPGLWMSRPSADEDTAVDPAVDDEDLTVSMRDLVRALRESTVV